MRPTVCVALLLALAAVAVAGAEPRTIELAIRKGELPQGQRVVRVRQGDDITLRWTTDTPLAVHLHGYDIEMTLAPGPPTSTRFTARAAGRFPIEVHGGGKERTLGHLEVHPR